VVDMLAVHPRVRRVLYPGLPEHPGHDIAAKQMRGFGGMVSFQVDGGEDAAVALVNRTEIFTLAESLGGVESLIEHPGRMTHASAAGSPLEVPGDLIRLSVGLEHSHVVNSVNKRWIHGDFLADDKPANLHEWNHGYKFCIARSYNLDAPFVRGSLADFVEFVATRRSFP
jgi:hypothetical protein